MGLFSRAVRALTAITQNIFTSPHQNWLDNNGIPLASGRLYVYAAGTQTPVNTWQDAALSEVNTNPIILDGGGFTTVWLNPGSLYKFRMVNAVGEQQWTVDNYQGGSLTANILVPLNFIIPAFAPNTINNGNNQQAWEWVLTGSNPAFVIGEAAPSTGLADILDVQTLPGSLAAPFRAVTNAGTGFPIGLQVEPNGNIVAQNGAIFIGPVQIPTLLNQPVLGTDNFGNVIAGVGGGPSVGGIISINADTTAAQLIVAGPGIDVSSGGAGTTVISIAPSLASLTLVPASVLGPASSTGTVTLASPALAAGVTVTLSSNNANAHVPASVVIAAGATTATFTVTTNAVAANATATISGLYAGVTRTANLTVTAPVVATPIYGGVGATGGATSGTLSGTTVTLNTGETLTQLQTTAEATGNAWNFSPNNQFVYLLLRHTPHTFIDGLSGLGFAMNPPVTMTLGTATMYLYQSSFALSIPVQPKVAS